MIRIVDMPMGSGKTQSAISYMNENPDKRYIYVTPFLSEIDRIVKACPDLNFESPSNKNPTYHNRKNQHMRALIAQKKNIATTHATFRKVDDYAAQKLLDNGYVIIIDETLDIFTKIKESKQDIEMLTTCGYLKCINGDNEYGCYRATEKAEDYNGAFEDTFNELCYGSLVKTSGWDKDKETGYGFWQLNPTVFTLPNDIFIMTYMFDGSPMKAFLEINKVEYSFIGTKLCEDGQYRFTEHGEVPEYFGHVSEMVHICDKERINSIGDDRRKALTSSWTDAALKDGSLPILGQHIHAYFRRHVPAEIGSSLQMWSAFKKAEAEIKKKKPGGIAVPFNCRAMNDYGDRAALAYCVNIWPDPTLMRYLRHVGAKIDVEKYALSTMVQWIWRSRIRNGQEIWLYIPSKRMRTMLIKWMKDAEKAYKKEHEVTVTNA